MTIKVLITGVNGFVGKNLRQYLRERKDVEVVPFSRENDESELAKLLDGVDFVFHLAGVNRPKDPSDFMSGNVGLTASLIGALEREIERTGKLVPLVYTSSTQAAKANPYGSSKLDAENSLRSFGQRTNSPLYLFRLTNVFGKWCRPNYNSAVATFCNNIALGLPITISDENAPLSLVYVDDVVKRFIDLMDGADRQLDAGGFEQITPIYSTTVGHVAAQISAFKESRLTLVSERVGTGLTRALYSTYLSYLPPSDFSYKVQQHSDPRGTFVEMLKTKDSGQFSFFTAKPGITRGGHYHHSKTEKFLVISGQANFRFRHMVTGEFYEQATSGEKSEIVETVPGWTHDITNVGEEELVVMLWANEIFDRALPDTYACPLIAD